MMDHGGNAGNANIRLDFSANINFLGLTDNIISELNKKIGACSQYPDIKYKKLRSAIAKLEDCPVDWILCGNGASELLVAIAHAIQPARTLIPVPSFSGYERAARAAGSDIIHFELREEEDFRLTEELCSWITPDIPLLILANPNNPVGNRIPPKLLSRIMEQCRGCGTRVVLDECFYDFMERQEEETPVQRVRRYENLLIVRAFTKIYAMPGVRLGYLICSDESLRKRIELQLPEWNISTLAQAAGVAACRETAYREKTPWMAARERDHLVKGLERLRELENLKDLVIYPSEANFLLLRTSFPMYGVLFHNGILIRDCSNFRGLGPGYYRIAVRSRSENEELLKVLEGESSAGG